ncbi:hypothetical protein HII36_01460 [Nonomuraea sp. NN258]|uniref:hypothetical protein n=1 Tax=Nonomuraea antri TaxID=2730852 RepID=UPI0015685D6A|nr:hypothetical protein [Nonomuraea antri]NRQ30513.1 hypothetical protein [Nonomuraea antri]
MDDITTEATTAPEPVADVEGTPQFENDADRWKYWSRLNENKWKRATADLEAATARAAELEQNLAQLRQQDTVRKIRAVARDECGVELDDKALSVLNLAAFLAEDGEVDSHAISGFLGRFGPSEPKFDQHLGIGPQGQNRYSAQAIPRDARQRR